MSLTYQPFADCKPVEKLRRDLSMNLTDRQRTISTVLGAALLGLAATNRGGFRWLPALLGAALVHRGWSGWCALSAALDRDTRHEARGVPGNRGIKIEEAVEIQCPADTLYRFWRNLGRLPSVMRHVESVVETGTGRSHWKVQGPGGYTLEWDAEIINEREGELIAWQSLPGSVIRNAGSVWFEASEGGSTRVKVALEYEPPAGVLGERVAELLGSSPREDLAEDLVRFKLFAERELQGVQGETPASV